MSSEEIKEEKNKPAPVVSSTDQDDSVEVDDAQLDSALAEVDELLADEDPAFLTKMLEISGDKNINASNIELADAAGKVEYSLWLRIMFFVLPGSKFLFLGQRKIRAQLQILRLSKRSPKEFFKDLFVAIFNWSKAIGTKALAKLKYFIFYFRALSNKAKLLFVEIGRAHV